ncbi:MAG: CCA tRNA nucleotidyltransferase, partial [Bacilli bacterium]|nr:CCA tRNA nucleotidyltransferase [Bacilli bacterium]
MNDQLENAKKVLEFLTTKGHKAYLVGGFVRDFLLGMTTDDIDITTNARPEQVMDYFPGSKATGIKFGTVTVIMEKDKFEVTTFRTESRYRDSRHPEKIKFADSLDEDLKRRDFTINALAMDLKGTVIDRFFGKEDLKDRLIRAIGNPTDRFQEDALRMLRAFRFVAKLDFDIETRTFDAIKENNDLLKRIANERIFQELKKIIIYPHTLKALCLMRDAGIPSVLPGLKRGIDHLSKLDQIDLEPLEFYALCFVLNDGEIPKSWRFSNKDRQQIEQIVKLVLDKKNSEINELDIFNYGKKNSLQANRVLT